MQICDLPPWVSVKPGTGQEHCGTPQNTLGRNTIMSVIIKIFALIKKLIVND